MADRSKTPIDPDVTAAKDDGGSSRPPQHLPTRLTSDHSGDVPPDDATFAAPAILRNNDPKSSAGWVGPYRLGPVLGEGGMGTVYQAEQYEPVRRTVALKLIRSSIQGAMAIARFTGERQALARLSHPNIATLFDAGTTADGCPFFAMEHLSGAAITDYCDAARLTIHERVELFIAVCAGVQHAHQKGIIHRDLKPSNILVTDGTPKVIDFGIAKAIDQPLTEQSPATLYGIVGTPAYMSPEAFELSGSELDTRTDVYALGVILYELLAGVRPHAMEGLQLSAMMRKVSEDHVATPLARYRTLEGETRELVATARRVDAKALSRALAGDLGWIARKATTKDREERYASAAELAADLSRHLRNEPVTARPPSVRDRTTKFVRRHRVGVAAAAIVVFALLGGLAATVVSMVTAQRARAEAESVANFIVTLLASASPFEQSSDMTVRAMLDQAAQRIPKELADQPQVRAELLQVIGSSYFHLNQGEKAEPLLREALRLRIELFGPDSTPVAQTYNELALVRSLRDDQEEAERMLRQSIAIRERLSGHEHHTVAVGLLNLASVLSEDAKRRQEAERLFRETLAMRERFYGPDSTQVAMALEGLGALLTRNQEWGAAEPLARRALLIYQRHEPDSYSEAKALMGLGQVLTDAGRFSEAEPFLRRALELMERFTPPNDVRILTAQVNLGVSLRELEQFDEAARLQQRALAIALHNYGRNHPYVGNSLIELGLIYTHLGRRTEAEKALQEALQICTTKLGADHGWTAWALWGLANLRREEKRYAEAETYYKRALEIQEKQPGTRELRTSLRDYATLLAAQGRGAEAAALLARAGV